ncbi:MAG: hypothetical protein P1V97_09065 [Planctomycetota bacterium]|nr:hypothetical protein [Planctomycetota bacterium]
MIPRFFITDQSNDKPSSKRCIFADGSKDKDFRPGQDLELSHWVPNQTPEAYKADTSTEICLNYVAQSEDRDWDLAINNHTDVDGLLSIFALTQSELALQHRETVIGAAEMGDFFNYAPEDAQRLFQGLTLLMNRLSRDKENPQYIYECCLQEAQKILLGTPSQSSEIEKGLAALSASIDKIDSGAIARRQLHERFVSYEIPREFTKSPAESRRARKMPSFNALLDDSTLLLPQARNKYDRQRIQLVSVETERGFSHDLHYPAYSWAETPNSWRAPGLSITGSVNVYLYSHPQLIEALAVLNEQERGEGNWESIEKLTPFTTSLKRKYPIFASFMGIEGGVGWSSLSPELVGSTLAEAFLESAE